MRLPVRAGVALMCVALFLDVVRVAPLSAGASPVPFHIGTSSLPAQRREPSLPQPLEETAAAAVNGRLYVIGGFDAIGRDTDTVFVFDGSRWSAGPRLPLAVDHPAAAVLAGRLYVVGGFSSGAAVDRAFVLAPSGRAWASAGRLRHARGALALVSVGGALYALGGKDGAGVEVGRGEVYRPTFRRWSEIGVLPLPRDHLAGFPYRGWACAAGGRAPNTARVDCYDPVKRAWRRLPDLPVATSGAGAAADGRGVVVGGGELAAEGGGIISQLARLARGRWVMGAMLVPRHGVQFAPYRGRIWACGGGIAPGLHPVSTCTSIGAAAAVQERR